MNLRLALSTLLLTPGMAHAQTPPPTWSDLLNPSPEARQQACEAAIAYERANPTPAGQKYVSADDRPETRRGQELKDTRPSAPEVKLPEGTVNNIIFQLPIRSVGNICGNAAHEGRTVDIKRYALLPQFYVQREVAMLKDALKFSGSLRLLGKDGQELAQLKPIGSGTTTDQGLWSRECRDNVCRWVGFSAFHFNVSGYLNVLPATQTVQFVFDRGYGPETRDYQASDFTQLTLGTK